MLVASAAESRYPWGAMTYRILVASSVAAFGVSAMLSAQAAQAPVAEKSLWDGAYTSQQAELGAFLYDTHCAACHAPNMTGRLDVDGDAYPLVGSEFWRRHEGKPLNEIFSYMRSRMPRGAAGSLQDRDYAAILSYILQANGYPEGQTELPQTAEELAAYRFTDVPPGR